MIKILCIGDVVGREGCEYFEKNIRALREKYSADLVVVNGENSSDSNGISRHSAMRLYDAGADVITGGNHTFRQRDVYTMLDDSGYLVRPANYPAEAPGVGYAIAEVRGYRVLVLNVIGTVYMEPLAPAHEIAEKILKNERKRYDIAICDIHAEATSEKMFFARYFDSRLSAVFGTHTHVATADAQILPGGCGYITDVGMCGSHSGILGVKTECIVHKFTLKTPVKFEASSGQCKMCGVCFEIDESSGKCVKCTRFEV
ncbi:MAG: YmdB family metallophosphoesterase [Clostridia bacterium]|nr:YmdB family metallophosphoesterase [Clostridia bacterium]